MLGNVWEWCSDIYDETVYGSYRIFRGGGWCDQGRGCIATNRRRSHPISFKIDDLGFRIARKYGLSLMNNKRQENILIRYSYYAHRIYIRIFNTCWIYECNISILFLFFCRKSRVQYFVESSIPAIMSKLVKGI